MMMTLVIPDQLVRELKRRAVARRAPLSAVVSEALLADCRQFGFLEVTNPQ